MSAYFSPLTGIKNTLTVPLTYLPSRLTMTSAAASAMNYAASLLPQKHSEAEIRHLPQSIELLKAPSIVHEAIESERQALKDRKLKVENCYKEICGDFYEDPKSDIHRKWVEFKSAEARIPSGKIFDRTSKICTDPDLKQAFEAFQNFLMLEMKRQELVQEMELIGRIVNSDTTLKSEYMLIAEALNVQLNFLSGDYYEDPRCELDKLWKRYRSLVDAGAPAEEIESALTSFSIKDESRKVLEHLQFMLHKILSSVESESTNIRKMAEAKVEQCKKIFESALADAQADKGVDWRFLTVSVLGIGALVAAGYFSMENLTAL